MSDLKYPIGKFAAPETYTAADRAARIEDIRVLPSRLRDEVSGLAEAQRLTRYREGGWTVAQVVHHLADAHLNGLWRFKIVMTEDNPTLRLYDQTKWAELPDASSPDITNSLALVDVLHARWVEMLSSMTADDFARQSVHPIRGPLTLDWHLALYAWHGQHHLAHITHLAERLGWK